ncbi:UNVERIFIED_CONTAM: hypothetical protein HDU68_000579 [Siphonaria sp. JEL0065]|nr:hypothetical protein HDU68_000579 [Siphonaria sp. JEL0065]
MEPNPYEQQSSQSNPDDELFERLLTDSQFWLQVQQQGSLPAPLPDPRTPQLATRLSNPTLPQSPDMHSPNWTASPSFGQQRMIVPITETKSTNPPQRVMVEVPKQVPLNAPRLPNGKFQEGGIIINAAARQNCDSSSTYFI